MPLILIHSNRFADHQPPPGHPECPERAHVMDVVAGHWQSTGGEVVAPRMATPEQLSRVHDDAHLKRMSEAAGLSMAFDPDTYTSPETYEVACLAAGASVDAVERVMSGAPHRRALVLARPPGHHAERGQAMGFCFYNNVAVAAAHARALGAARVAVVDFDVHHGNGTQQIFESDPSVLYLSMHQSPFYPGTGEADEVGLDEGRGFTVNVPIEVGAQNADYQLVFHDVVVPVVRAFQPALLIVSAGFDAHERDPLAGMRLTSEAFAAMTADLRGLAEACCGGRLVAVTEGGYDLKALWESLQRVVDVLAPDDPSRVVWPVAPSADGRKGQAAVDRVRTAHRSYWRL
jgi:acetoin utilization deacetylase AcuC-like enzyme